MLFRSYLFSPMAIIDLIAIAPFYMTFIVTDNRIVRILRFLRILRMTKHSKHSKTFHIITNTIYKKRSELLSSLILMFSLLLICSTGVYFAENEAQPCCRTAQSGRNCSNQFIVHRLCNNDNII